MNAINIHEIASAPRIIQHGVPKGSVLGPLLFNISLAIADIYDGHQIRYHVRHVDNTECPPWSHAKAQLENDEYLCEWYLTVAGLQS